MKITKKQIPNSSRSNYQAGLFLKAGVDTNKQKCQWRDFK